MITLRDATVEDWGTIASELPSWISSSDVAALQSYPATAGEYAGVLLGIGGVVPFLPGVGVCWMVLTPCARVGVGVRIALGIRRRLTTLANQGRYRRLEAFAAVENHAANKLLTWLNFEQEGIARQMLPSGDAYRYAWLREAA